MKYLLILLIPLVYWIYFIFLKKEKTPIDDEGDRTIEENYFINEADKNKNK